MAGRALKEIVEAIVTSSRKPLKEDALRAATRAAQTAAAPAKRVPKPGQTFTVPNIATVTKARLDPQGYGNMKLSRPIEAYEPKVLSTNIPLIPKQTVDLAALKGQYLLPLYWDRSSGEGLLAGVGDIATQRAYPREGGADFMRGQAAQTEGAIVASGGHVIDRLASAANALPESEMDTPVNAVMLSMAPTGLDFSTFPVQTAADLLQQSKMTRRQVAAFDDAMGSRVQNWPGLLSPDLDAFLAGQGRGETRKKFMSLVDSEEGQLLGVPPDIAAAARYATTDETQRTIPSNFGGMTIGRINRTDPIIRNPRVPHSAYPVQLRGEYIGGLELPVHQSVLFPDIYGEYVGKVDKNGRPLTEQNMVRAIGTRLPLQKVNDQMIDTYGMLLEDARQRGLIP